MLTRYSKSNQAGISLIESMLSILLIAIMGLGLAYISGRALMVQRFTTTQNLAVLQMREQLQNADQTSSPSQISFGKSTVETQYTYADADVTIGLNGVADSQLVVSDVSVSRSIKAESVDWLGGEVKIQMGSTLP